MGEQVGRTEHGEQASQSWNWMIGVWWVLTSVLAYVAMELLVPTLDGPYWLLGLSGIVAAGTSITVAGEGLTLRRHFPGVTPNWMVATVLGYGWALVLGITLGVLFVALGGADLLAKGIFVSYAVILLGTALCGATLGLAQWFVLFSYGVRKAGWWIVANSLAVGGWSTAALMTGFMDPLSILLLIIPVGATTGFALVWILRPPVPRKSEAEPDTLPAG